MIWPTGSVRRNQTFFDGRFFTVSSPTDIPTEFLESVGPISLSTIVLLTGEVQSPFFTDRATKTVQPELRRKSIIYKTL